MMSRLGHVEFIFNKDRSANICRPCITIFKNSYKGCLCGYRTNNYLKDLRKYCAENDLQIEILKNNNAPNVICIDFKNKIKLDNFKNDKLHNILVTELFSEKILYLFPDIKFYLNQLNNEGKFQIREYECDHYEYFDTDNLKFVEVKSSTQKGLYKLKHRFDRSYFIYDGINWKKINEDIGKYATLYLNNKKNILKIKNNTLCVPISLGLPELIDRGISLLTGLNPEYDRIHKEYAYKYTDINIVKKMLNKLGQELEI